MAWTLSKSAKVTPFGFCEFCYSTDLQDCEPIRAAPAAGLSIYIEHLYISCNTAITVTVGEGETGSAVTTAYTTFAFLTTSPPIDIFFHRPIKLTAATAFTADASGAGAVTIIATGFTK